MIYDSKQLKTLSVLFEKYLCECQYSKGLRPRTLTGYLEVFNTFQKIVPEVITVEDLSPQVMTVFFKRISTRERIVGKDTIRIGVKPSTIKTYHNKLIAFFKWLEENNHIENKSLTQKIITPPEPIYNDERALTKDDISKIIASIALNTTHDEFLYKRDMLIISLLIYTGIRKTELLSLKVQDIDFGQRSLFINGKTSKSKKSRSVPLHITVVMHLKNYLALRKARGTTTDALIISSKRDKGFSEHGLKNWIQKYRRLSGVKFHLHQMRHSFACSLARTGADITTIMKALGHTTMRMTERYLRSINSENSRDYIDKLSY